MTDIRTLIDLVTQAQAGTLREAAGPAMPDFMDHMIDAVSNAQFGFHFEEGGCWGMALAIHDKLRSLGHNPEIVVTKGNTHAMVRDAGRLYDHSGEALGFSGRLRRLTPEALLALAGRCGVDADQVMADKADAAEIIEAAEELAQTGTLMEARTPRAFQATLFHGSVLRHKMSKVPSSGTFFSGFEEAQRYGRYVYECRVTLKNAFMAHAGRQDDKDLDASRLKARGYDGYVFRFPNGDTDVVAFHSRQIEILKVIDTQARGQPTDPDPQGGNPTQVTP